MLELRTNDNHNLPVLYREGKVVQKLKMMAEKIKTQSDVPLIELSPR